MADTAESTQVAEEETAALARGGRTSFFGFLLRLMARMPFLFVAGRLYGATALGRFAYATMVIEAMAALATIGLKRGLAAELARRERPDAHVVADGLALGLVLALGGALLLAALPFIVFPERDLAGGDRWLPLVALAIVASDISLAALAFRHNIGATVRARSIIEPWTLSLAALAFAFTPLKPQGLLTAYSLSLIAAVTASILPCVREYGWPHGWRPRPLTLWRLAQANLPLAGADIAEWGSRRLDIFILGRFSGPETIGIYYVAQQIATLPQKLKTSFDPVLAPLLTRALADDDAAKAAAHVRQTGFWVGAVQLGVVVALALTGRASMGLFGPAFAGGFMVLGVLLVVELFAAQAAVAEAALVYVAPRLNLLWSLSGLVVQAVGTVLLVPKIGAVGAAAGLAISALFLSVGKMRALGRRLDQPVASWRWSMVAAAGPAIGAGVAALWLPEWFQLTIGLTFIVAIYGALVWRWSFRGPDRLLFARGLKGLAAADAASRLG